MAMIQLALTGSPARWAAKVWPAGNRRISLTTRWLAMNTSEFDALLPTFEPLLRRDAAQQEYADREFWDSIGTHVLDVQLSRLANFYGKANATQRRTLRSALNPAASWNLLAYVRRMAIQILETKDPRWLISALQIASLENATFDFRDSIVSLVIARAAAESVSIDPLPHFARAISQCDSGMVSTFTNARDHRPSDVRDILRAYGPPQLKPKRKRKTN